MENGPTLSSVNLSSSRADSIGDLNHETRVFIMEQNESGILIVQTDCKDNLLSRKVKLEEHHDLSEVSSSKVKRTKISKLDSLDETSQVNGAQKQIFARPLELPSKDSHAQSMYENLTVGMTVRCCKAVQKLSLSDTGTVIQIDRNKDLHDINVKVQWNRKGIYYVRYDEIEIWSPKPDITQGDSPSISSQAMPPAPVVFDNIPPVVRKLPVSLPSKEQSIASRESAETAKRLEAQRQMIHTHTHALVHACQCYDNNCRLPWCKQMKDCILHYQSCSLTVDTHDECKKCKVLIAICKNHARQCTASTTCPTMLCGFLKEKLREEREQSIQRHAEALIHACQCHDPNCQIPLCQRIQGGLLHIQSCNLFQDPGNKCQICCNMKLFCRYHAKHCTAVSHCPVPMCATLKAKKQIPSTVHQHQNASDQMTEAVKCLFKYLGSPRTPEGMQQVVQIVTSHPQLVASFNQQRTVLLQQLEIGLLSDEQKQHAHLQIQHIDQVYSILKQVAAQTGPIPNSSTSVGVTKSQTRLYLPAVSSHLQSSQLRELCCLPTLSDSQLARFHQLAADKTVDVEHKHGETAWPFLSLLLRYNQSDSVLPCLKSLLLRDGINLEHMKTCGHNALTLLLRYNISNVVFDCAKLLLERGVNVLKTDSTGRDALLLASELYRGEKMLELVQLLLQHGADASLERKQENVLIVLSRHYKQDDLIDVIRLLITHGVNVNCRNSKNQTALHALCQSQNNSPDLLPILKLLVQHGIDATAVDGNLDSALTLLCRIYRQPNLLEIIRFLVIDCGVSVNNTSDDLSRSILLIVCQYQSCDSDLIGMIRFFIERGLSLTRTDNEGKNILHLLCQICKGQKLSNILRLLTEETQVDVHAVDNSGMKPLDIFLQQKRVVSFSPKIIQYLGGST